MDFKNYIPPDGGHVGCGIGKRSGGSAMSEICRTL